MTISYHEERHFGEFGGQYVPETLLAPLEELTEAYKTFVSSEEFQKDFKRIVSEYSGRPTPLTYAQQLSRDLNREIYLKREDLNHTGAHKLNNAIGQILLADRMDKERIIAETGAGQHGVAVATVCAYFDKECIVYMGEKDIKRQSLNVYRMELLGAQVEPVKTGARTLKDATSEAIRDWVTNVENTHYLLGSVVGPYPYPDMVRDFQAIIGEETKEQFQTQTGTDPDGLVACIGGGSNAMGLFAPFLDNEEIELFGVEAAGEGIDSGRHSAPLVTSGHGVLHGSKSYLMSDEDGQVQTPHSVAAGLDYPGVGPQLADLKEKGRLRVKAVKDDQVIKGFKYLSALEGIIPALEPAHVFGLLAREPDWLGDCEQVVINLSGSGDKDVLEVAEYEGRDLLAGGEAE